jgi:hypothetical protein
MPYKDPARKRQWEQARRQERTARRKAQRHVSHQTTRPTFVKGSPWATRTASANSIAAAALAKARQLREGKTQVHPSSKEAAGLRSMRNECGSGQEGQGSGWGFWLAVAAAVLGLFLPLSGIPVGTPKSTIP